MSSLAVQVEDLGKQYQIGKTWNSKANLREHMTEIAIAPWKRWRSLSGNDSTAEKFWALRHVNLEIADGQAIGIIGKNGSGKSTLLKILSRISPPTEGRARVLGRVGSLLEVGTGFHPELTGRENIYLNGSIIGMKRAETRRAFDSIVEFAEVSRFIDTPVKRYSTGMYVRLAFSVAAHLQSDILIVDEVLAVGDAAFQSKCLGRMNGVARSGRAVLFVSHNMQAVCALCDYVYQLEGGSVLRAGHPREVAGAYLASTSSRTSEVNWPVESAPGTDAIRLIAVRACTADGCCSGSYLTTQDVYLEAEVVVNSVQRALNVSFDLLTADGTLVLQSNYSDTDKQPEFKCGKNHLRCRVPGRLLNEGLHYVGIRVETSTSPRIIDLDSVIQFQLTLDHLGIAAGLVPGRRLGTIAPALEWSSK